MIPSEDIVKLLQRFPHGLPSQAVAKEFNVGNKVVNGRLSKLAAYGVIKSRRDGSRSIYTATVESVAAAIARPHP